MGSYPTLVHQLHSLVVLLSLKPETRDRLTHALAFQSTGERYTVAGLPIARDAAVLEVALDLHVTRAATVGMSYAGQIAASAQGPFGEGQFHLAILSVNGAMNVRNCAGFRTPELRDHPRARAAGVRKASERVGRLQGVCFACWGASPPVDSACAYRHCITARAMPAAAPPSVPPSAQICVGRESEVARAGRSR